MLTRRAGLPATVMGWRDPGDSGGAVGGSLEAQASGYERMIVGIDQRESTW